MKFSALCIVACLLAAGGCVSKRDRTENAKLTTSANRIMTCEAGADCQAKWSRAAQWIKANAAYSVTAQSDSLIETAGPSGLGSRLGFTASKKPVANSSAYAIAFFTRCNDWLGCTPSQLEAKASFADFVMGAPPPPKPVLGVQVIPVTPDMAQQLRMSELQGLGVTAVTPDSPASKAGLLQGDIITRYDGTPVVMESALAEAVGNTPPGKQGNLEIVRGKAQHTLTIVF